MANVTQEKKKKKKGVVAEQGERYCKTEKMTFLQKNCLCFFHISQAACLLNVAFAAKGLVILY